jgi:hypothetical protein
LKRVHTLSFLMLLAAGLTIFACEKGEGEPCQADPDCASGLVCCVGDSARGVCGMETDDGCDDEGTPANTDASQPLDPDAESESGDDAG